MRIRSAEFFDVGPDFIVLDEFAPVGGDALADGGTEVFVLFEQAQGGILDQMLRAGAGMRGEPSELRFLFGREMHFHAAKSSALPGLMSTGLRAGCARCACREEDRWAWYAVCYP